VLATDALIAMHRELAPLTRGTLKALDSFLSAHWSHNNPIDILGDAEAERYARVLEIAAKDANSDGPLVIPAPQGMTNPAEVAAKLTPYAQGNKPLLASFMGGESMAEAKLVLNRAGIPLFPYPDTAARVFSFMARYRITCVGFMKLPYPQVTVR
jgi:acetyltransferase